MDLEAALVHLGVPTLIVTTRESGLQSVAAVERYVARIPDVAPDRAAGRQLSHCGGRARCVRATCLGVHAGSLRTQRRTAACRRMISLRAVSKTRRAFVGGILGTPLLPMVASTQPNYPSRTVRIIVPFPPGGGADIVSRLFQPHLTSFSASP